MKVQLHLELLTSPPEHTALYTLEAFQASPLAGVAGHMRQAICIHSFELFWVKPDDRELCWLPPQNDP